MPRIGSVASELPVPGTRHVDTGTGLEGGGALAADLELGVVFGTAAGTVTQGNDTRFGQWSLFTGTPNANGQTPVWNTSTGKFAPGTPPATMDAEQVRDIVGATLVAGSNVSIVVNDAADTITISSVGGGGTTTDATTTAKGIVQLAGDLGGTAAAPTVPNKAESSRQVIAGAGLTGGGNLTADRTLAVAYGTTTNTALQGSLRGAVNGVAPLDASGLVPQANLPISNRNIVLQTGATGTVTLDASLGSSRAVTIAGNTTFAAPTNPVDGQRMVLEARNGAGVTYTVTFTGMTNLSGVTLPVTLAPVAMGVFGLYYSARETAWFLLSANWET